MEKYAQNNFNQSNVAKKDKNNKVMVTLALIATTFMLVAFKHAMGG